MKRFLTILITIVFLIIVIVLGLKNQQLVTVNYIIAQNELRLSTLLAIIFTLGFAGALSLASYFFLKLKMKNRKLHKLNAKQRKELNNVRDRISQE
ncbi:LapA family protein [Psychromonas aquatilis]|uniref:Probable lipopolysaccharide assembly protein A n=1 Tax=Psychromonas aquatilis TaxID=2005072 RepID=A0ABU9GLC7_9GAMM